MPSPFKNKSTWTLVGPMGPLVPQNLLSHSVLGVDGGAHFASRLDIWVGDSDSYEQEVNCLHLFRHPREKDRSDLSLALSLFEEQLIYQFHLWGFSGGRFDHEIFNLGEILSFLKQHPESQVKLYNDKGVPTLHLLGAGDWKFDHEGTFSLGSTEEIRVKMTGHCRYPILTETKLFPLSSFGLSNEAHGSIVLVTDSPCFIYYPEGK